jgi:TonB family protein
MSVDRSELVTEDWTRWQGHLVNGVFPLGRLLGASHHSGVFLTRAAQYGPADVAIKLVPADRATAELLLPRWKRAGNLTHPHLLRMFEWGGCQLEGLPYLYVVMEYADQTLGQLLSHRALTEEEAREMLPPAVDALAFLHHRNLLHGALKPANILVVGDQLKLASDTIRRVSDARVTSDPASGSLEQSQESPSQAEDVRGLGITLLEALSRPLPAGLPAPGQPAVLPPDFSPAFRELVARCLSADPKERPGITDLLAWVGPQSALPAADPVPPASIPSQACATPRSAAPRVAVPEAAPAAPSTAPPSAEVRRPGNLPLWILGAVVFLAMLWGVGRLMRGEHAPVAAPSIQSPVAGEAPSAGTRAAGSAAGAGIAKPIPGDAATAFAPLHEATPDISPGARSTIHGRIKVWVRVTVAPDGTVSDAVADRAGPSRYFERIAVEAARKWTFPPADGAAKRLVQVRFEFSREGITGRAIPLR